MTTYYISEQTHINDKREHVATSAQTLTAAKRAATRAQVYQDTIVCVWSASGELLAYRGSPGGYVNPGARWQTREGA